MGIVLMDIIIVMIGLVMILGVIQISIRGKIGFVINSVQMDIKLIRVLFVGNAQIKSVQQVYSMTLNQPLSETNYFYISYSNKTQFTLLQLSP